MVGEVFHEVGKKYPHLLQSNHDDKYRIIREVVRRIISKMIIDLIAETRLRLKEYRVKTVDDIRHADVPMVVFSEDMERNCAELKEFLRKNMYKHPHVNDEMEGAKKVVRDLFAYYYAAPQHLPSEWQNNIAGNKTEIVGDFIAGMTDRYALQMVEKI